MVTCVVNYEAGNFHSAVASLGTLIPHQVKIFANLYRHISNYLLIRMNKTCSMIAGGKLVFNNLAH